MLIFKRAVDHFGCRGVEHHQRPRWKKEKQSRNDEPKELTRELIEFSVDRPVSGVRALSSLSALSLSNSSTFKSVLHRNRPGIISHFHRVIFRLPFGRFRSGWFGFHQGSR